jgi:NADH-quinone oxidoreductase subunit L
VALLVPALPLFAAIINSILLLAGDKLARRWTHIVACTAIWLAFAGAIFLVVSMAIDPTPREVVIYEWMSSGGLSMPFGFLIDPLSATMMLLTTSFSSAIWIFSINYMHNERGFARFFTIMPLMVFSMIVLTGANNYALMFLGWEAVGLCMYLVISFYYDRASSARSGTKAMVMNRIGDAAMLLALFLIFDNFGTLTYTEVFARVSSQTEGTLTAISLCLTLGILGKSCQLPLGTWLSSAMEGPTPASAMIHAAVQDGIYLVARSHGLFDGAPNALLILAIIGATTAVYAAVVGLAQTDIKGLLAFSTTSQLGLMVFACGLGAYPVAVFHMLTHACVKTFLFLTSPSILHHLHGGADPAEEGRGMARPSVATRLFFVALVALAAFPFLSGWWQDALFGRAYSDGTYLLLAVGLVAAFSVAYSTARMVRVAFGGHGDDHESGRLPVGKLVSPLAVVAGVIGLGFLAGLLPGGIGGRWFADFLAPIVPTTQAAGGGSPLLGLAVMGLMVLVLLAGWATPLFFDRFRTGKPTGVVGRRGAYAAALNRFYLDDLYDAYVVRPLMALARFLDRFDSGFVDRATGVLESDRRPGPIGRATDASARGADWIEGAVIQQGVNGNAPRLLNVLTGAATWIERRVFQAGINRGVPRLGEAFAAAATWVERWVFQAGVNEGTPRATRKLGKGLTSLEAILGNPLVVGAVFVAFIVVGVAALLIGGSL